MCRGRVYLLERHYTATGHLYHRHCYRAAERTATLRDQSACCMDNAVRADRVHAAMPPDSHSPHVSPSHSQTTSSRSTGLMKALYSTDSYKPTAPTTALLRPAASSYDGRCTTASSPTSAGATSQHQQQQQQQHHPVSTGVSAAATERGLHQRQLTSSQQHSSASVTVVTSGTLSSVSLSQHTIQHLSSTSAHACYTATAAGHNVASSSAVLSVTTGLKVTRCEMTSVSVPLTSTSRLPNFQSVAHSATYISPFVKQKMLTPTMTASCSESRSLKSLQASVYTKSIPALTSSTLYTECRHLRTAQKQNGSATNCSIDDAVTDSAMVSSVLEKLAEARQRKEQTRPVQHSSAVWQLPAQPVTLSTGNSRPSINSRPVTAKSNKTEWQLEAERRQAARNGVYVDPEKYPRRTVQQQIGQQQQCPGVVSGSNMTSTWSKSAGSVGCDIRTLVNTSQPSSTAHRLTTDFYQHTTTVTLNPQRYSLQQQRFMSKKSASIVFSTCSNVAVLFIFVMCAVG